MHGTVETGIVWQTDLLLLKLEGFDVLVEGIWVHKAAACHLLALFDEPADPNKVKQTPRIQCDQRAQHHIIKELSTT